NCRTIHDGKEILEFEGISPQGVVRDTKPSPWDSVGMGHYYAVERGGKTCARGRDLIDDSGWVAGDIDDLEVPRERGKNLFVMVVGDYGDALVIRRPNGRIVESR